MNENRYTNVYKFEGGIIVRKEGEDMKSQNRNAFAVIAVGAILGVILGSGTVLLILRYL